VCSHGLSNEAIEEICDAAELEQFEPGEYLHRSNEVMTSVCLIVHGRIKQTLIDMHGRVMLERFLTRGSQFGLLGAAEAEPVPVDIIAVEPTAVLRIDFDTTRQLARKHDSFGLSLTRLIAGMVRQVLQSDRAPNKPSLITIFHETSTSRQLTGRIIRRFLEMGETPCLMSDQPGAEPIQNVPFRDLIEDGQQLTREDIRRQINLWSDSKRVILDVDAAIDPVSASLLVEFSDQVLWCSNSEAVDSTVYRLKAIESRVPGWRDKINLIWMLDSDAWIAPMSDELRELTTRQFKISFSELQENQGRLLLNGFERLLHHLRGIRIGLALGGGGARGMAHLGVLKALEEHGIVVDMIAGTSAGAMTGILYAAGLDIEHVTKSFIEDLKPSWFFRMIPRGSHWYLLYKYRRGHFDIMLRKYLSDWPLERLPLPVHAVTVDLVSGEAVVRDRGDAVNAILESINMPVFSQPICRDGRLLVDGGLVNNIPADVLVKAGCNFVIAVSVTARLEQEFVKNRPETPTAEMSTASILQTILRSYVVQSVNMHSFGVQPADVVIEPDATGIDLSEFSRTRELATIGEAATLEAIPKIKTLLNQLDNRLFPDP